MLKGEDDNVNVYTISNFLAPYGISSSHLQKIGTDHVSRVHGGKNDSSRRHLRQLRKIGHASSVEHYDGMNDKPDVAAEVAEIIDLYKY